jgi:hypothetical protein
MRIAVLSALIVLTPLPGLAQPAPPRAAQPPPVVTREPAPAPPRVGPCCVRKVWDARNHEIGDVVDNPISPAQPWGAAVAYRLKGGDAVVLMLTPESFNGVQSPMGGSALFVTPDCSGNAMFAMLNQQQPLAKRYAMVVNMGWPPGPGTTHAWLWVSDPVPVRAFPPAGTVFHSQWDSNACSPYPAPGYTLNTATGFGGYPMHRVEDLLAKYTRPFWINY